MCTKGCALLYNNKVYEFLKEGIIMKRIKDVFSDYNAGDSISAALVEGVVLSKKTKTLELKIKSEKYIDLKEIKCLNDFIKKRFALEGSRIIVNYTEDANKRPTKEELKSIFNVLSEKYPALKSILRNSEYEIEENKINFVAQITKSVLQIK